MDRIPVQSRLIRAVGYHVAEQVLEVQFLDGSVYQYFGVPEAEYTAFRRADSLGGYLNERIKGAYRYEQVS